METERERKPLLSQLGGIIAMVCFFLPWASCHGDAEMSGAQMGDYLWLVFLAAGTIAFTVRFLASRQCFFEAKIVVIACSASSIVIMATTYLQMREEIGSMLTIEYGGFGALGGFLLALYGAMFLKETEVSVESTSRPREAPRRVPS